MDKLKRYSPEVRERAVRLVFVHQGEYESQWAAIKSIVSKIGSTRESATLQPVPSLGLISSFAAAERHLSEPVQGRGAFLYIQAELPEFVHEVVVAGTRCADHRR